MANSFIFSSESVTEGHPDKVCDTISDYVVDACFAQDPTSRVACETMVKDNAVILGGEITTAAQFANKDIIAQRLRRTQVRRAVRHGNAQVRFVEHSHPGRCIRKPLER